MRPSDRFHWTESEWLSISDTADARSFLLALALLAAILGAVLQTSLWRLYAFVPEVAVQRYDRIRVMHRLASEFDRTSPDVLMVGGSQLRELFPDDAYIESDLSESCGRIVRVFNAATSSQLPSASLAMVDHFSRTPPSVILVAVNPWRIHHDGGGEDVAAKSGLPLPAVPVRARVGILLTDYDLVDEAADYTRLADDDAFESIQHRYRGDAWAPARKRADAEQEVRIAMRTDEDRIDRNVAALADMAAEVSALGGRVVFVLPPHSPEADEPYRAYTARMDRAIDELARAGEVLDLTDRDGLASDDFYDAVHVLRSGRVKLWPRLRSAIVSRISGCAP